MEPGNVNMVQLSPTVQATRSNYTMVHGGKKPLYIEYFLGDKRCSVLYDQLQSEQGTRYFRKRNRNIIVEIPEESLFEITPDFTWMTIGQLQRLTRYDNLVHLDCRSIIGGLSYGAADYEFPVKSSGKGFGPRVFDSMTCDLNTGECSHAQVLSWLAGVKFSIEAKCEFISLNDVGEWMLDGGEIRHRDKKYFSVVGVSVEAESREVSNWTQPLVQSKDGGIIGLVCQMREGILHVLVQALTEPGMIDIVELAPTVQFTPANYSDDTPAYVELLQSEGVGRIIVFDSMLSEEGGRFFHSEQRHLIVEVDADQNIPLKVNYCWMTLRQLQECGRYNNYLNIEMRSILCCISPLISE
ncbi:NDP-hexose 2,3-dehydratase family protein, partial [Amylibacter sp.]|nr:NDP-hexose 2,3-dehydratase family protein [Amylibacter sp.]